MDLRGLEVLLATLGGVLLVLAFTSGLTVAAVGWAALGVGGVLLIEAALLRQLLPHYGSTRHWARVAARLSGVRLLGDGGRTPPKLRGTVDQCAVRIDRVPGGWRIAAYPIHRDGRADVQLSLRWADGQRGRWRTGDPAFDRMVEVQGAVPEGLLALDDRARRAVVRALSDKIEINLDRVQWSGAMAASPIATVERLRRMAELAQLLYAVTPDELRARARRTVRKDPHPEVRARALWLYQEHYAMEPDDQALIREALHDPHESVRLAAAGAEIASAPSAPHAEAMLAEAVARGECPPWALDAAVERLVELGRPEVITAAMQARLRDDGPLPAAVLRWAVEPHRAPRPQTLGARLLAAPEADAEAAVDILVAAGPRLEEALITLLEHASDAVIDRALEGLAFGGSQRAVPALQRLTRGLKHPRRLRHAAMDALAAVRARRPHASTGRLSLIDPSSPVGHLSVVE